MLTCLLTLKNAVITKLKNFVDFFKGQFPLVIAQAKVVVVAYSIEGKFAKTF